jgi:FAD dependent oxidoreductase TIGR03364
MHSKFDVIVVGGGIVGLAHAWMAADRGLHVLLIERSSNAAGASVRNFGMLWPIGQPAGEPHSIALRSRARWLELNSAGVVDVEECGSIHATHRTDELAVVEEFRDLGTHDVEILNPEEVLRRAPIVNPEGLLGGMFSDSEMRVNPRVASAQIATWLGESKGVTCLFDTAVGEVDGHTVKATDGRQWRAERVVICSGSDLQTLFPDTFRNSGLKLCKLQMLKAFQEHQTSAMPHVASGLTLRHYSSFGECPSLPPLRQRIASETPELDRYGIHVMASVFESGDILLGDSHEYDAEISPFDKAAIDDLILRELRKVIRLRDWTITERWHGIYAKHAQLPVFESQPEPPVHLFVGTGGSGMTMAFGLAEQAWNRWMGKAETLA